MTSGGKAATKRLAREVRRGLGRETLDSPEEAKGRKADRKSPEGRDRRNAGAGRGSLDGGESGLTWMSELFFAVESMDHSMIDDCFQGKGSTLSRPTVDQNRTTYAFFLFFSSFSFSFS